MILCLLSSIYYISFRGIYHTRHQVTTLSPIIYYKTTALAIGLYLSSNRKGETLNGFPFLIILLLSLIIIRLLQPLQRILLDQLDLESQMG